MPISPPQLPPIDGDCYPGPEPYSNDFDSILAAAEAKFSANGATSAISLVPRYMLENIYYIESFGQWNNPNYDCRPNDYTATGLMQITDTAYNWVVPPDQRIVALNGELADARQCDDYPVLLSRCNSIDAIELAARVLLVKIEEWDFIDFVPIANSERSSPAGITDLDEVYCSAYGYYGSFDPDGATNARGSESELDVPEHPEGGTNYSELVCYDNAYSSGGICTSAGDYPNPRPASGNCFENWP